MLLICERLSALKVSELMQVYHQSVRKWGEAHFPDASYDRQLLEAEQNFIQFLVDFYGEPNAVIFVLSEKDRYISALRSEPFRDGLLITGLETAPELRNQGYGSRLLKEVLAYYRSRQGIRLYSHIKKDNVISQKLHKQNGFILLCHHAHLLDGTVSDRYDTYCLEPIG